MCILRWSVAGMLTASLQFFLVTCFALTNEGGTVQSLFGLYEVFVWMFFGGLMGTGMGTMWHFSELFNKPPDRVIRDNGKSPGIITYDPKDGIPRSPRVIELADGHVYIEKES